MSALRRTVQAHRRGYRVRRNPGYLLPFLRPVRQQLPHAKRHRPCSRENKQLRYVRNCQQLQAFAKKNSNGLVRFEVKANREREPEPPIRAAIEALQISTCHDCGREAKVSPAIAMSAYTCLTRIVFLDMHARGTIL